jgi:zinc-binding in reverse transcriptase
LIAAGITIQDDTDTGNDFKKMLFNEWNSSWNKQFLLPEIRSFLFKFYANTLKTNSRSANFNPEINQACDFCIIKKNLPAPKESIQHLFWDCEISNRLLQYAINEIFGLTPATKNFFFTGWNADPVIRQSNINLNLTIFDIMKYVLWEFKWSKKVPDNLSFSYRIKYFLNLAFNCNKKLKMAAYNTNLFYLIQR